MGCPLKIKLTKAGFYVKKLYHSLDLNLKKSGQYNNIIRAGGEIGIRARLRT